MYSLSVFYYKYIKKDNAVSSPLYVSSDYNYKTKQYEIEFKLDVYPYHANFSVCVYIYGGIFSSGTEITWVCQSHFQDYFRRGFVKPLPSAYSWWEQQLGS